MIKFVLIIVVAVASVAMASEVVSVKGHVIPMKPGPILIPHYQMPILPYPYVPVIPVGSGHAPPGGYTRCEATPAWNTPQTVQYCRVQCALGPAYCPTMYCRCK